MIFGSEQTDQALLTKARKFVDFEQNCRSSRNIPEKTLK